MSSIESLAQIIQAMSSESERMVADLSIILNSLEVFAATLRHLMEFTGQDDYDQIQSCMFVAINRTKFASQCVMAATRAADDWIQVHVNGNSMGDVVNHFGNSGSDIPDNYSNIINVLNSKGVEKNDIKPFSTARTKEEIINRIGGGDMTEGSCSSLALAYVGNLAGYDVLDFRGGGSRLFFASNKSIEMIANLPEVDSVINYGVNDIDCSFELLSKMQDGKEYYFATGEHASIVRRNGDEFEYLELQSQYSNGWHLLDENSLFNRFGCVLNSGMEMPNFLIDTDSLAKSPMFLDILGFLNTNESEQKKGEMGNVK